MKVSSTYSLYTSFVISHLALSSSSIFVFLNIISISHGIVKSTKTNVNKHSSIEASMIQMHGTMNKELKFASNVYRKYDAVKHLSTRYRINIRRRHGLDHPNA